MADDKGHIESAGSPRHIGLAASQTTGVQVFGSKRTFNVGASNCILVGADAINTTNPFIQGETYTLVMADGHGDGWLNQNTGDGARIILSFDDSNPPPRYVHKPDRLH